LKCKEAIRELSNFLDGEIGGALKVELEQHFQECDECNLLVIQTRKTIEFYIQTEPTALPHEMKTRLHGTLRKKLSPPA
jgi:predicted anti-sigma-YlaC factor YlaD